MKIAKRMDAGRAQSRAPGRRSRCRRQARGMAFSLLAIPLALFGVLTTPSAPGRVEATNASITAITIASFPCNNMTFTGTITFSDPYTGTVTLFVTSHLPGGSQFVQTGGQTTVSVSGTTSATFSVVANPVTGANSYRVEVLGASDPTLGNQTVKAISLYCDKLTPTG